MLLQEINAKWYEVWHDLETLLYEARKFLEEGRYSGESEKEQLEAHVELLTEVVNLINGE